ncbi:hypothetical protein CIP107546_00744 [Corynebacterium diphtheriae]|nr:hypothetical protein CIP107546_00744 [Corynebacterium diphtheriae]
MKTLVEPTALALLIAVDEYGSVSAAADIVGTSQANASRSLSRAEHRLGAQLLNRGPQGTTLNAAGQIVVQHARTIIRGYHDLEAAFRNLGDSPVGYESLPATPSLISYSHTGFMFGMAQY